MSSKEALAKKMAKKMALKQLEKVNPDAELSLDSQGFVRMHRKKTEPFSLPENWKCEEGNLCMKNTITLRHLYKTDGEFIVTMMVYQNA